MPKQFQKPFPEPGKGKPRSISEQDTLKPPQVHAPDPQAGQRPASSSNQNIVSQQDVYPPGQPMPGPAQTGPMGNPPLFVPPTQLPAIQRPEPLPPPSTPYPLTQTADWPGLDGVQKSNAQWNKRAIPTTGADKKDPPSTDAKGRRNRKKRRFPIWARILAGFLLVLLLITGGGYWYYQVNLAPAITSMTGKNFTNTTGLEDPNVGKPGSLLNWGRVNILLLGSDTDEKPEWGGNSFLAQTDIILTIDTNTHDVGLLSIPRDFWLNIPGYGLSKLDTAFAHGGSLGQNNDMSGVGVVEDTLKQDFGITINFYAWIGLNGFVNLIQTVGGVDVNVIHPILDDNYPKDVGNTGKDVYAYTRLYIPAGLQHLNNIEALEYVRSRHSTTDFNRSQRQQQVLDALKLKLDNPGIVGQIPQLIKDLQGSIYTQLQLQQLVDLANFARGIDTSKIRHLTLGPPYATNGVVDNQDVAFPDCAKVTPAINSFLHMTTGKCQPGYTNEYINTYQTNALTSSGSTTGNADQGVTTTDSDTMDQLRNTGLKLSGPLSTQDSLSGLRSLLDLLSIVVLNSPQI